MIVGFTGSQSGMTNFQEQELVTTLRKLGCSEFLHGDCIGSDARAMELAVMEVGIKIFTIYPPLHDVKRAYCYDPKKLMRQASSGYLTVGDLSIKWLQPKPYLERNKDIVNDCAYIIACPKEHTHTIRSGTWATIRYSWKHKKDNIIIIPPIERES